MKASKYNMFWTLDNGTEIAFNSFTCALAEVDKDFFHILDNICDLKYDELSSADKELVDNMLEGNFIIKDNIDELKLLKHRNYQGKFTFQALGLTIAPTLACNFACPYCYESPKKGIITEEVQQGILNMVKDAAENKKNVNVTWYGGEPLLAMDAIRSLSTKIIEICNSNSVQYTAYMVSNGYLLNDEIIGYLKAAKVDGVQLTIDGPPRIHNTRRKLKACEADTFTPIMNGLEKMLAADIRVNIRINVDKTNTIYINELLDIFEEKGIREKIGITFGHVTPYTETCSSISSSCMNTEEYAKMNLDYQEILHARGFYSQGYPYYPGIKANYCCADNVGSYVVDHEGYLYKCWNDVGSVDKSVGNVTTIKENSLDEDAMMRSVNYMMWSPFEFQECVDCSLLPVCMGGCPFNGIKNSKPKCEKWKYTLEESLKNIYVQKTCTSNCGECTCH